ncbi:MAG: Holliday junction branch migration DNA helicase RuvB [Acidimicrobiales bacterium]
MSPRREVLGDTEPVVARAVDPIADEVDEAVETGIRPRRLAEFVGQSSVRSHLEVVLEAARRRGQPVDHLLFAGPPGLGKTTLAGIVAAEMGAGLRITSGPALGRGGDIAALLTDMQPNDVLFIDEIHRLNRAVEEILYPAMEDYQIDVVIGKGPAARSVRLELPPFTLVGATTRTGLLTGPLRDRFGFIEALELYSTSELEQIVHRTARLLGVACDDDGATEIARRSRGTPRLAIRLLRRVRDYVEVKGDGAISGPSARDGCTHFGVDELGLDGLDKRLLQVLCVRFAGRPVGLTTLAVSVGEEPETVEDVYEPYLLQSGLVMRTPRGRVPGPAAWAHLGLVDPDVAGTMGAGLATPGSRAPDSRQPAPPGPAPTLFAEG